MKKLTLRTLTACTLGTLLLLHVLAAALMLPSGFGIEDLLRSVDRPLIEHMVGTWNENAWRIAAARAYLVIDIVILVPLYATLLIQLGAHLISKLKEDAKTERPLLKYCAPLLQVLVLLAVLVDQIENIAGLARLGPVSLLALGSVLAAISIVLTGYAIKQSRESNPASFWFYFALLALLGGGAIIAALSSACHANGAPLLLRAGCAATAVKQWPILGALVAILMLGAIWVFGALLALDRPRRTERAALRLAILDIFFRSRYVLCALGVFVVTGLVMPQGRDILYAVFAFPTWWARAIVLSFTGLALAAFGSACWIWTRSVCLIQSPRQTIEADAQTTGADDVARDWARVLGIAPGVLMVLLCAQTVRDSVMARDMVVPLEVYAFTLFFLLWAWYFLISRTLDQEEKGKYYSQKDMKDWLKYHFSQEKKYRILYIFTPFWLPIVAGSLMLFTRLGDIGVGGILGGADLFPPFTIATLSLALTFWVSLFGWLSLYEESAGIPWIGLIILLVGVFGFLGLTENHVVSPPPASPEVSVSALSRLGFTAVMFAVVVALYVALHRMSTLKNCAPEKWMPAVVVVGAFYAALVVLSWADAVGMNRPSANAGCAETPPHKGKALDAALAEWLQEICEHKNQCDAKASVPFPVFFVTTEGGGIRASHWTALVLSGLHKNIDNFALRTFSISGVSGGSVGAAGYRACALESENSEQLSTCVRRFGEADLLSPLLGSWMFEDLLARLIPTGHCKEPGCGFMSRANWFESTMTDAVPALRIGLVDSREKLQEKTRTHTPYLLLNSTWVESGERAIASELIIDWHHFPTARDQIALLGYDPQLSTAAHNSARFPFVNALGAIRAPAARCEDRDAYRLRGNTSAAPLIESETDQSICGHLADGGYVDNSGALTTINILDGLARCLEAAGKRPSNVYKELGNDHFPNCRAIPESKAKWLRENLQPQILFIRNGVDHQAESGEQCVTSSSARGSAFEADVAQGARPSELARPACSKGVRLFSNTLGIVTAAVNTLGIASGSRMAAASQEIAVRRLHSLLAAPQRPVSVVRIELIENGTRYPLGWHLSVAARCGMEAQFATWDRWHDVAIPTLSRATEGKTSQATTGAHYDAQCPNMEALRRVSRDTVDSLPNATRGTAPHVRK